MRVRYAISQVTFKPSDSLAHELSNSNVICGFLPLLPGDRLCVHSEKDGWCFGSLYGSDSHCGLFPTAAVDFVCKSEHGFAVNEGTGVVEEINQISQRWWAKIKDLYGKYAELHYIDEILDYIDDLITTRKKILSGDVPAEELNLLRAQVAKRIDRGNLLLSLPVVIRQENGCPHESDGISLLQTFQEHVTAERRVTAEVKGDGENSCDVFTLLFSVHSIELKTKYNCEVSFIIYDYAKKVFVSEPFSFIWKQGDDRSSSKDLKIRAFISNFSSEDSGRRFCLLSRIGHISPIENSSSTIKKVQDVGPVGQFCRQVYAFDFLDLSNIFDNPKHANDKKEKVLILRRNAEFDSFFKAIQTSSKIPRDSTSPDDIKVIISTQVLRGTHSDISQQHSYLYSRKPPLVVLRSDKIDLPIWNTPVRNELFVTLQYAELGSKNSDRNIEARLAVVRANGSVVADCFESIFAPGPRRSSEYRSYVFFHQDKPYWMECTKILMPEATSEDLHLRITLYSRKPYDKGKPEKGPFALAHVSILQNAAVIKNEEHELLVYKIESSHGSYDDQCSAFMPLPQTRKQLRDLGGMNIKPHSHYSLSEKNVIHISTKVCSNVFTLNDCVLNVLRWRTNSYNLEKSLITLATPVGEAEEDMLRFMCPMLDCLFEIWDAREQNELQVFNVFIAYLRLLDEPRHTASAERYAKYMEKFSYGNSALKLMKCLHHYIVSASTQNNDLTRNSLKMIGGIFQVIVAAKLSMDKFSPSAEYVTKFRQSLDAVLDAVVNLMREQRERMTIQNIALKYLPQIIDPILRSWVYDANALCSWVIHVINAFGQNIVARERLGFIGQLIDTLLFEKVSCRAALLPKCLELVTQYMDPDECEKREYPDRVTECVTIVSSLIERIFPVQVVKSPGMEYGTDDELNLVISACYRPSVEAMVALQRIQPEDSMAAMHRKKFFALILALLNKMSAQIFDQYLKNCETIIDKMDFVVEMLQMIRDLLNKCPFAATWEQMILLQNKTINKALRFVMSSVQNVFSDEEHYSKVWEEYMLTAVSFVTQESLQTADGWLKDESDACFQLRKAAAKDLRSMWFRLKVGQKMEYIPRLVGAFLKVALMEDPETRDATIPIFLDMMQCEFHSAVDEVKNFKQFADELIEQLDALINEHCGSRQFQEHFTRILTTQCQSDKDLWQGGGREFIARVDQLIQYLFEYRNAIESGECVENAMSRTVQLMNYYYRHGHYELYVVYIYKLYDLHIMYNNDIEAAKTLLLHAETLTWDDVQLPEFLVSRNLGRHCATERQLKEELLSEVADLFSKGQMWEDAIRILRILEPVYEKTFVDFRKLAEIWDTMADLCRRIDAGNRVNFYYYFVGFYGKGYPAYLNGKRFVFRSDELERLQDFKTRMEQMYGGPEAIPSMDDCSHLENSPGRYIQTFQVDPLPASCSFDERNVHINPKIKEYHRHYNMKDFEFSRTEIRKESKWTAVENSDIMKTWILKRRVVTYESLPGVLRFSQIISCSSPIHISPLRRAVDQMKQKNQELMEMATFVRLYPDTPAQKVEAAILGVAQANVQGGIKNYEIFFSDECARIYEPEEKQLAMQLSAHIIEQVEILEYLLYAHANQTKINEDLHAHLIDSFVEHKRYVEDKFGRTTSMLPAGTSLFRRRVSHISDGVPLVDKASSRLLSTTNLMDLAASSTGTLKSRGATLSSTVLNMLSPVRKATAPPSTAPSPSLSVASSFSRTTSVSDAAHMGSRVDSMETIGGTGTGGRNLRLLSTSSIDGIRIRSSFSRDSSALPPPLPTRPTPLSNGHHHVETTLDRNVLLGDRTTKPPIPTPIGEYN